MSYYAPGVITELTLIGVASPGVPNRERVLLRPMEMAALNGFGVGVGVPGEAGGVYSVYDNVFWFPGEIVEPPSWIIVFTGQGTNHKTTLPSGEKAQVYYWQRKYTVFDGPNLVPFLFKVSTIIIGQRVQE